MDSKQVDQLMRQAVEALNTGDYRTLQQLCNQILNLDKNRADAWFFMSLVADAGRRPDHALKFIDRALKLIPDHVEYLTQKAKLHSLLNHYSEALETAELASRARPDQAIVLDTLGVVYTRLGKYQQARELLQRAVDRTPENPQFQFNLGSAEQFLGNETAARVAYRSAIKLKPDFCRAYWALSELEKDQPEPGRLNDLLTLQASCSDSADRLYLSHAISREYEKRGQYRNAFDCLAAGKQQRKAQLHYSVETDLALFKTLEETFSRSPPRPAENDALNGRAIFIVGMPRTGTTLLDRIVSSHSRVTSLGELQEFPRAVKKIAGTGSSLVLDNESVSKAAMAEMHEIAAVYRNMLGDRIPTDKRFIDKLPLNFLTVGFIINALSEARVICLRRNALDTCLSNFRQLFALNFSYYNYHYDLADTARFYVAFDSLMKFWQLSFPDRFHQINYENLVDNPENSVREIMDYLALEWEPGCLNFHTSNEPVATASASQVRRPLYRDSVARWKKYAEFLQPAMEILDQAGIEYR